MYTYVYNEDKYAWQIYRDLFFSFSRERGQQPYQPLSHIFRSEVRVFIYTCVNLYMFVIHVCVYTYTYMDTCVYTHTHIIFSLYNETKRPLGLTLQHTATGSFCDFIYSIWRSIHVQYIYAYLRIHMHVWEHKYKHIYIYINTCAIRSVCG